MSPAGPDRPLSLDYAAAPSRARRALRRSIFVLIITATALATYRWGPTAWKRVQVLYWQRQCMTYTAAADMVVYEEEPAAAKVLLTQFGYSDFSQRSGSSRFPAASYRPDFLDRYLDAMGTDRTYDWRDRKQAVVFLGQIRSPSGLSRPVAVALDSPAGVFFSRPTFAKSGSPPILVVHLEESIPIFWRNRLGVPPSNTRIFAGQRDPADPSHFTIRYQMWGQEDVIDGRVDDKGMVTITLRRMPTAPQHPAPG